MDDQSVPEKRWQAGRARKMALIRDSAVTQFSKYGYAGSSLQDVAKIAGLHKATLYHYFESKELLLAYILDYAHDQIAGIIQDVQAMDVDSVARIRAFIKLQLCWYLENVLLARVTFHEWTNVGDALIGHQTERRRHYDRFLRSLIQNLQDDGLLFADLDVGLAANFITGAVNAAPAWFDSSGRLSAAEVADRLADLSLQALGVASRRSPARLTSRKPRAEKTSTPG